jgi:ribosomal-protein-alanine N-acetyltransferase
MNAVSAAEIKTVQIRPMKPEDLEQVVAIDRISFSLPWPPSAYRYELYENPLSSLWVAEVISTEGQSQVVGILVVWVVVDEAHIATLAVHPEYRGRGVAQSLLVEALKEAIDKGLKTATLEVRANNTIAQRLYHRFRFEVVGRRPRYYLDNHEDALIMTVSGLGDGYAKWLKSGAWRKNEA